LKKNGCLKRKKKKKSDFCHQEHIAQYGPWLRALSPTRKSDKSHGVTTKQGYAASEHSEADEKAGGAQNRAERRRAGKEPEVQGSDDANAARGTRSFNENGSIGGKNRFSSGYHEAFHAQELVEKARADDGDFLYSRNDLHEQNMGGNNKALMGNNLKIFWNSHPYVDVAPHRGVVTSLKRTQVWAWIAGDQVQWV
jgi:hypothetical protein